jgi:hypothetical protein
MWRCTSGSRPIIIPRLELTPSVGTGGAANVNH